MPHSLRIVVLLATVAVLAAACRWPTGSHAQTGSSEAPEVGACRLLTPQDVASASNATDVVPCTAPHTAQTFWVQSLPARFAHASYDDAGVAAAAYLQCSTRFQSFTGADQSLAMRTILTWAWFRPSKSAWDGGARWYRCDVVGGGDQSRSYVDLPATARHLLSGRPKDAWLVCAQGETVADSVKVPCSQDHQWRAVTTIVLGGADDAYPGDDTVQRRTKQFCSTSVGAWLGYPVDFDYGYSWFHQAEWDAGNRRSVCWSRTTS